MTGNRSSRSLDKLEQTVSESWIHLLAQYLTPMVLDIPELFDGAPVSIQVATSRMRDEEAINIARVVDSILNKV